MAHRVYGLCLILTAMLLGLTGCNIGQPQNPSFPLEVGEAQQAISQMEQNPVTPVRPVVIAGGWGGTNLAKLPLGLQLGPVRQPFSLNSKTFENQGEILHVTRLIHGSTRVVGDFDRAARGTLNAAGVVNDRGDRVDVFFRRVVFEIDAPVAIKTVVEPKADPALARPQRTTRNSMRRFCSRPSAVWLSATGCVSPKPSASRRAGSISSKRGSAPCASSGLLLLSPLAPLAAGDDSPRARRASATSARVTCGARASGADIRWGVWHGRAS